MKKVLILGASGMLGHMVTDVLSSVPGLQVVATTRTGEPVQLRNRSVPTKVMRIGAGHEIALDHLLQRVDYVINCIGITKPFLHKEDTAEIRNAVECNVLFPHLLAEKAALNKARVLQIATDCVYSGNKGMYTESSPRDALDAYGKTKCLGEVQAPNFMNLRCSIIGPELGKGRFLLAWLLSQQPGATVNGFTNHSWNGVTTYHFAQFCLGIIQEDQFTAGTQHIIPGDIVTKYDLLRHMAGAYNRSDIQIKPVDAGALCDRTLQTERAEENKKIWHAAGYATAPTIQQMVEEMSHRQ